MIFRRLLVLFCLLVIPLALSGFSLPPKNSLSSSTATPAGTITGNFQVTGDGAASYQIPIAVPPGVNGVAPHLTLSYNHQRGNGIVGMGWAINGLSSISRCGANVTLDGYKGGVNFDNKDRLCLDGMRLINVKGEYWGADTVYETEHQTWSRIKGHNKTPTDYEYFTVENKDGTVLTLGATSDSRILGKGRTKGVVRIWAANQFRDRHQNYTDIRYFNDFPYGSYRIDEIIYTGNPHNAKDPLALKQKVKFEFETRPDKSYGYIAGGPTEMTQRLTHLKTYVDQDLVSDYQLKYQSPGTTGRSRLASIARCDAKGQCLPATTFEWQDSKGKGFDHYFSSNTMRDYHKDSHYLPMDLDGDGKSDVVQVDESSSSLLIIGYLSENNSFNQGMSTRFDKPTGKTVGYWPMDVNGDGSIDLVQGLDDDGSLRLVVYRFHINRFKQVFNHNYGWRTDTTFSYLPIDLDGDGRTDLVQTLYTDAGLYFVTYKANGNGFSGSKGNLLPTNFDQILKVLALDYNGDSQQKVVLAASSHNKLVFEAYRYDGKNFNQDFLTRTDSASDTKHHYNYYAIDLNGDGKMDIVRRRKVSSTQHEMNFYLAKGYGFTEGATEEKFTHHKGEPLGTWSMDIDGNSQRDLVDIYKYKSKLWVTAYQWNHTCVKTKKQCLEQVLDQDTGHKLKSYLKFFPMDVNGDSKPDIVEVSKLKVPISLVKSKTKEQITLSAFLQPTPYPDLLTSITNGIKGKTTITYDALTHDKIYKKGSGAIYPIQDVQYPMYVVSQYSNSDGRGASYAFEYHYQQGRYDKSGIGWIGFNKVTMTDLTSKRYSTITYNQTDSTEDKMWARIERGTIHQTEVYTSDGKLQGKTSFLYKVIKTDPHVQQVMRSQETIDHYTDGVLNYTLIKKFSYDDYGHVKLTENLGDANDLQDDLYTCVKYSNDKNLWRLGFIKQEKHTKTKPACETFLQTDKPTWNKDTDLGWLQFDYHDPQTMDVKTNAQWDDAHNQWLSNSYTYDNRGRLHTITTPAEHTTTFRYEQYRASERHVSIISPYIKQSKTTLTIKHTYELFFGNLVNTLDANLNTFSKVYDSFGRLHKTYGPNPLGDKTQLKQYELGMDNEGFYTLELSRTQWDNNHQANWFADKIYIDGLGRDFKSVSTGTKVYGDIIVEKKYDPEGRLWKQSLPYYKKDPAYWVTTTYTKHNYPDQITYPDGTIRQYHYQLGDRTVSITNAYGTEDAQKTTKTFNAHGNPLTTVFPNNSQATYQYDPLQRLSYVKNPLDQETHIHYDSLGRQKTFKDADTGLTQFFYDPYGLLKEKHNAAGQKITYHFDEIERLSAETLVNDQGIATQWFRYTYDTTKDPKGYPNTKGRLAYVEDFINQNVKHHYGYNAYGAITTSQFKLDGTAYHSASVYNPMHQLKTHVYPDGATLTRHYDPNGTLHKIDLAEKDKSAQNVVTYSNYDALKRVWDVTFGNTVFTTYIYWMEKLKTGKLENIMVAKYEVPKSYFDQSINWNQLNSVTSLVSPEKGKEKENQTFTYDQDNMEFLKTAESPSYGSLKFDYDVMGGLQQKDQLTYTYYPGTNKIKTKGNRTFLYDDSGRLAIKKVDHLPTYYTFDADGRLTNYQAPEREIDYLYAYNGGRIKTTERQKTTRYINSNYKQTNFPDGTIEHTKYVDGLFGPVMASIKNHNEVKLITLANAIDRVRAPPKKLASKPTTLNLTNTLSKESLIPFLFLVLLLVFISKKKTQFYKHHRLFAIVIPLVQLTFLSSVSIGHAATLYYHQDHIGSTVALTDAAGQRVGRLHYYPYGSVNEKESSGTNLVSEKFTGAELDTNGYYYFGARYYDPDLGSFISPDPTRQYFNPYSYGNGNPESGLDPDGDFFFVAMIVVGALVGAYMGGSAVNHDMNPAHWNWKDGKTYAGIFGGAAIGAVGGAAGSLFAEAGIAVGIAGEMLVGAGENAAFTAMGGGNAHDILAAAAEGAVFGGAFAAAGAGLGAVGSRLMNSNAGRAVRSSFEMGSQRMRSMARRAGSAIHQGIGACNSFVAGTPVLMASGQNLAIEKIKKGDEVATYNEEKQSYQTNTVVQPLSRETDTLTFVHLAQETIETTPNHPFYVKTKTGWEWREAQSLKTGDQLLSQGHQIVPIKNVEHKQQSTTVYNFKVAEQENYFVSDSRVLVHNPKSQCRKLRTAVREKHPHGAGRTLSKRKGKGQTGDRFIIDDFATKPYLTPIPGAPNGELGLVFPYGTYKKKVKNLQYTGSRSADFTAANNRVGISKEPPGYVWHHFHDVKFNAITGKYEGTLYLVKHSQHTPGRGGPHHHGGVWQYEQATGIKYTFLFIDGHPREKIKFVKEAV